MGGETLLHHRLRAVMQHAVNQMQCPCNFVWRGGEGSSLGEKFLPKTSHKNTGIRSMCFCVCVCICGLLSLVLVDEKAFSVKGVLQNLKVHVLT